MKRVAKRILALLFVCAMLFSALPALASEPAVITVETKSVSVGTGKQDVAITLNLENNPGIAGCTLLLSYDSSLAVKSIVKGSALATLTFTQPGNLTANPLCLVMDGMDADTSNGTLFTITFTTPISEAKKFDVALSYNAGDIYDQNMNDLDVQLVSGGITVGAEAHTHNYATVVTAPTCTEQGYTTYSCTCGESYVDNYATALGHNFSIPVTKAATETATGYEGLKCSRCDEVQITKVLPIIEPGDPNAARITVESKRVRMGQEFTVDVSLANNPGIIGMSLNVNYDADKLEYVSVAEKDFSGLSYGNPAAIPFRATWEDALNADNKTNGTFVQLTFRAKEDIEEGSTSITITYDEDNVFNANFDNVQFFVSNGEIEIVKYDPGDVNRDGNVNLKDIALLKQYVNGWNVDIETAVADVTGDGKINLKDVALLKQFVNGWNVVLK